MPRDAHLALGPAIVPLDIEHERAPHVVSVGPFVLVAWRLARRRRSNGLRGACGLVVGALDDPEGSVNVKRAACLVLLPVPDSCDFAERRDDPLGEIALPKRLPPMVVMACGTDRIVGPLGVSACVVQVAPALGFTLETGGMSTSGGRAALLVEHVDCGG